jgi:5-methyltetrahydrofolate--homocysteine methyltransferase
MSEFLRRLQAGPLVADGATGTNLQQAGLVPGEHSEEWILDHPERILALETAFVEAGADIILTCTFGATAIRMKGSKYESRVQELNAEAARLARQAARGDAGILVAGSMGPLGKLLKPLGPLTRDEAVSAYAAQAHGLASGGVDLLVIETQFALDEARAAMDAIRQSSDLPVVVSFSYDRGTRTMMGVRSSDAVKEFHQLGAAMIGVNCGTTLENALLVLQEYSAAAPDLPVWVKPNAGLPRMDGSRTVYDVTPEQMGEFASSALRMGARVVGGCCGSTPLHIKAIAGARAGSATTS